MVELLILAADLALVVVCLVCCVIAGVPALIIVMLGALGAFFLVVGALIA